MYLLRPLRLFTLLICLLLMVLGLRAWDVDAWASEDEFAETSLETGSQVAAARKVNAPYFEGDVRFSETAIFWFGRVTPTENYVDVRVGYDEEMLFFWVETMDRRLWYDTSPSPQNLAAWDAATVYLDLDGNTGNVPDADAFRFDAQLVWWEPRPDYQVAYRGDGSGWVTAGIPFTTTSNWAGNAPNDNVDDRGWSLAYYIPFSSLGLTGPPAQGTVWGMAVALYDRDDGSGTPIPVKTWPEAIDAARPGTWGQLAFGLPVDQPQPAIPEGTTLIRQGLNGATVMDADVGGDSTCGALAAPDYFPSWGELNYAGKEYINIQNLGLVSEWPCFSKYYVTFPLTAVPAGKTIIAATLTMYQFGNAGSGQDPQPSLIQVHTVDQPWTESTINWNKAPLAMENVSATWAGVFPSLPGEPRVWDLRRAVAEAYSAGTPLRLALYESDWAFHSGKYFRSSDFADEEFRPTLSVTWGRALADLSKSATPPVGFQGDRITYTLDLVGSGNTLTLTDTLPAGVGSPGDFYLEGTSTTPVYHSGQHVLTWTDTPTMGPSVVIRFSVDITTGDSAALVNSAVLRENDGFTSSDIALVLANPNQVFLPTILKSVN